MEKRGGRGWIGRSLLETAAKCMLSGFLVGCRSSITVCVHSSLRPKNSSKSKHSAIGL